MSKATHSGTCQICGSFQKLPNGVLSKHGYTVQWGFFSGVCSGAAGKPFEKSTDLIEAAVRNVELQIAATNEEIETLKTETENVWLNVYETSRYSKAAYRWVNVNVSELTVKEYDNFTQYFYQNENMPRQDRLGNYGTNTLEEVVKFENARYINHLQRRVKEMQTYVDWQTERVNNWVEKDLVAVEELAKPTIEVGSTVKVCGDTVTVTAIESRVVHGVGPSMNGRHALCVVWISESGKERHYPKRYARLV